MTPQELVQIALSVSPQVAISFEQNCYVFRFLTQSQAELFANSLKQASVSVTLNGENNVLVVLNY